MYDYAGFDRRGFFLTKSTLLMRAASSAGVRGREAADCDRFEGGIEGEAVRLTPRLRAAVGADGGTKFLTRGFIIGASFPFSCRYRSVVTGAAGSGCNIFTGRAARSGTAGRAPGKGAGRGDVARGPLSLCLIPFDAGIRGPCTVFSGGGLTVQGFSNGFGDCETGLTGCASRLATRGSNLPDA